MTDFELILFLLLAAVLGCLLDIRESVGGKTSQLPRYDPFASKPAVDEVEAFRARSPHGKGHLEDREAPISEIMDRANRV